MKKALSLLLMCVLLYQAGGFALKYIFDNDLIVSEGDNTETLVVKIPISLPYQTNWEAPKDVKGELRDGDDFYQMKEQIMENDTLYTTLVADRSARENFFDLANQVNEHLSDQPEKSPTKTKLINTLVKEYCAQTSGWVFYILEWPAQLSAPIHPILSTQDITSDFFSPPRQA